ncbi:MAG TPA: sigma-70 family RNA polymerase sigma factor [Thermoanaerobaculia bacterium]|nr:sigma-70 family RNA polymerase sigma factor [Thermoanaerobaculia bacterium]
MPSWGTSSEDPAAAAHERRLVARFRRRRDPAAFEGLYELARRPVYAVCLHFLREAGAAEDACHDVFVQAWERFETMRGERFLPWVRTIATHHCLNQIRRHAVARRVLPASRPEPTTDLTERTAAARQELELARGVLDGLSPHQREVFLLRHLDGLGLQQIEEVTGYSSEQVRSYLQNARRNFANAWERLVIPERGHG